MKLTPQQSEFASERSHPERAGAAWRQRVEGPWCSTCDFRDRLKRSVFGVVTPETSYAV